MTDTEQLKTSQDYYVTQYQYITNLGMRDCFLGTYIQPTKFD